MEVMNKALDMRHEFKQSKAFSNIMQRNSKSSFEYVVNVVQEDIKNYLGIDVNRFNYC